MSRHTCCAKLHQQLASLGAAQAAGAGRPPPILLAPPDRRPPASLFQKCQVRKCRAAGGLLCSARAFGCGGAVQRKPISSLALPSCYLPVEHGLLHTHRRNFKVLDFLFASTVGSHGLVCALLVSPCRCPERSPLLVRFLSRRRGNRRPSGSPPQRRGQFGSGFVDFDAGSGEQIGLAQARWRRAGVRLRAATRLRRPLPARRHPQRRIDDPKVHRDASAVTFIPVPLYSGSDCGRR